MRAAQKYEEEGRRAHSEFTLLIGWSAAVVNISNIPLLMGHLQVARFSGAEAIMALKDDWTGVDQYSHLSIDFV
jgi:hypothetical protein